MDNNKPNVILLDYNETLGIKNTNKIRPGIDNIKRLKDAGYLLGIWSTGLLKNIPVNLLEKKAKIKKFDYILSSKDCEKNTNGQRRIKNILNKFPKDKFNEIILIDNTPNKIPENQRSMVQYIPPWDGYDKEDNEIKKIIDEILTVPSEESNLVVFGNSELPHLNTIEPSLIVNTIEPSLIVNTLNTIEPSLIVNTIEPSLIADSVNPIVGGASKGHEEEFQHQNGGAVSSISNPDTLTINTNTKCALGVEANGNGVCSDTVSAIITKIGSLEDVKKQTKCGTERCILEKLKAPVTQIQKTKRMGPARTDELLSNHDIDGILSDIVNNKPELKLYHMSFQMIDFAGEKDFTGNWKKSKGVTISPTKLGKIDMVDDVIKKGYKKFFVVLNTDKRTGEGIHWFSLFCDFTKPVFTIEYFNSSGRSPYPQIHDWLVKTDTRINNENMYKSKIWCNTVEHQITTETECGLYALYYIWNRINDIPPEAFNKRVPDEDMLKFRAEIFDPLK